jgi:tRNA wybutosine-synthesizing protein 1
MSRSDEERPLLDSAGGASLEEDEHHSPSPAESLSWVTKNQWIILALASGACAAFNGVFAKS